MKYLQWFALAIVGIFVTLTNFILSPIIALFINKDGYLPIWLNWFQTQDNPAWGMKPFAQTKWGGSTNDWWCGVVWATRNPGYGYDYKVGAEVTEGFTYKTSNEFGLEWRGIGEGKVSRAEFLASMKFYEGSLYRTLECAGKKYWEWVWVKKWSESHYCRIKLGWALWNPLTVGQKRNIELTISPYMSLRFPFSK